MAASVASRPVSNGGKPRVVPIGTDVAILDLCRSGVALAEPGPLSSWGGARNRVDRESRFLSVAHAENIAAAAGHALQLGLPLNRHVTWHLEKSGVAPGDGAKAIGRFLKLHGNFSPHVASRSLACGCVRTTTATGARARTSISSCTCRAPLRPQSPGGSGDGCAWRLASRTAPEACARRGSAARCALPKADRCTTQSRSPR